MKELLVQDYMLTISEQAVFIKILPTGLEDDIGRFCESFPKIIDDLETLAN